MKGGLPQPEGVVSNRRRARVVLLFRVLLLVAALAVAGLFKRIYRPLIYRQGISDFGFANSAPSFLFTLGVSMLVATVCSMSARLRPLKYPTMMGVGIGALLYEIAQASRPDRWFDWTDVLAVSLAVLVALLVERILSGIENKGSSPSVVRRG